MGLYYQIASRLMLEQPATVCIVRPFPGHMTRFPFHAFSETPLDRYLWDGSHLFRQFLRYMIETQWFLSVLVRRSSYRCASGANLLAESDDPATSRLDDDCLAEAMESAWHRLHSASRAIFEHTNTKQPSTPKMTIPDRELFEASITSLRSLLRLAEDYPGQDGDLTDSDAGEPALHVLGYSLGGFTAQSVFMSWPFLISSCATLLAGGALRDLAPTAFADPEEWQTVLHSLRYELDDRMMSRTLSMTGEESSNGAAARPASDASATSNGASSADELVAGMDLELFTYFKRTFYEVFQQDYRGSFRTRLEAFRQRMLFVVGGNDPIVRPSTVLKSSPPGGINLLEIGGLGHFIGARTKDEEENEQRSFWLPEIAALIHRFANKTAGKQATMRRLRWFDADLQRPLLPKAKWDLELTGATRAKKAKPSNPLPQPLSALELLEIGSEGALPGALFERCLDDLLARMIEAGPNNGMLFILRNEVPTMLLGDAVIRERAAALYHDDMRIVRFCHGASLRQQVVRDRIGSVCLVLPWNAKSIMLGMDAQPGYPSQSESAGGQVGERLPPLDLWRESAKRCKSFSASGPQSVRIFDGNAPLEGDRRARLSDELLATAERYTNPEPLTRVAALPDCWVWVSRDFLYDSAKKLTVERAISDLARVVPDHCASNEDLVDFLRNDDVRIVTVSRARYNPRFRGRLLVTAPAARKLLIHLALCVALSDPIDPDDEDAGFR
jgi:pimeloyl-ACP methyl ester carboxylesterase